jgi:hypothetical protein
MSKSAIDAIQELTKALEAGGYNAAPPGAAGKSLKIEPLDLTVDEATGRFKPTKDPHYPHTCPNCKGPAYIGARKIECKAKCK